MNARQCDPLWPLDPETRVGAWKLAVKKAGGVQPTSAGIKAAAAAVRREANVAALEEIIERDGEDCLVTLLYSPFQQAVIAPGSVDVVVADPPYGQEWFGDHVDL